METVFPSARNDITERLSSNARSLLFTIGHVASGHGREGPKVEKLRYNQHYGIGAASVRYDIFWWGHVWYPRHCKAFATTLLHEMILVITFQH